MGDVASVLESITLDTLVTRSQSYFTTDIGGELVMMSVKNGAYFGLNSMGAEIWARIERPIRVGDLCADLVMEFQVEPDICREEVVSFIVEMSERGLVEHAESRQPV